MQQGTAVVKRRLAERRLHERADVVVARHGQDRQAQPLHRSDDVAVRGLAVVLDEIARQGDQVGRPPRFLDVVEYAV